MGKINAMTESESILFIGKLNPSAKEFVPTSYHLPMFGRMSINGSGDALSRNGKSSGHLSTGVPRFVASFEHRSDGSRVSIGSHNDNCLNSKNHFNGGIVRIGQHLRSKEECIRRTVHVIDIDRNVTEEHLAAVFSNCGQVLDIRICGDPHAILRSAFIEFANECGARTALSLEGTILGFFPITVIPSKTAIFPINPTFLPRTQDEKEKASRTIYCTNIDKKVTHIQLKDFFESLCGQVSRSKLLGDHSHSTRIAFVEFSQAKSALAALNCSSMFLGAFPIRVSPSKTPIRSRIIPRPK